MRCCLLPCSLLLVFVLSQSTALAQKAALNESIQRREAATWEIALKIWEFAEPGYQETRSARLLADTLEQAGFVVKPGVADSPMSDSITRDEAVPDTPCKAGHTCGTANLTHLSVETTKYQRDV